MNRFAGRTKALQEIGKLTLDQLVGSESFPFGENAPESQQQKQWLMGSAFPAPLPKVDLLDSLKKLAAIHRSVTEAERGGTVRQLARKGLPSMAAWNCPHPFPFSTDDTPRTPPPSQAPESLPAPVTWRS